MEVSIFQQWQILLICLGFGIPCGVLYDVFRLLRKAGLNSNLAVFIEDTIFMCLCAVWLFLLASAMNFGVVRWYMAAAFFGGVILYRVTLGVPMGKFYDLLVLCISRLYNATKGIVKRLFSFFCKQTGKITVIFCLLHKNYKEKSKNTLQDKTNKVYNYKKHSKLAFLKGRRNSRERNSARDRAGEKAEKKA